MKKIRQPIAQIGALTLWKLACAAASDVAHGDDSDPYVKEVRKLSDRAVDIAWRRMRAAGLTLKDGGLHEKHKNEQDRD